MKILYKQTFDAALALCGEISHSPPEPIAPRNPSRPGKPVLTQPYGKCHRPVHPKRLVMHSISRCTCNVHRTKLQFHPNTAHRFAGLAFRCRAYMHGGWANNKVWKLPGNFSGKLLLFRLCDIAYKSALGSFRVCVFRALKSLCAQYVNFVRNSNTLLKI